MPFKSESQRRYMWANMPRLAKKWAHKYHNKKHLPYHAHHKAAFSSRLLKVAILPIPTSTLTSILTKKPNAASGINLAQAKPLVPPGTPQAQPQQPAQQPNQPVAAAQPTQQPSNQPRSPGAFIPTSTLSSITQDNPTARYERMIAAPFGLQAPPQTQPQQIAAGSQDQAAVQLQKRAMPRLLLKLAGPNDDALVQQSQSLQAQRQKWVDEMNRPGIDAGRQAVFQRQLNSLDAQIAKIQGALPANRRAAAGAPMPQAGPVGQPGRPGLPQITGPQNAAAAHARRDEAAAADAKRRADKATAAQQQAVAQRADQERQHHAAYAQGSVGQRAMNDYAVAHAGQWRNQLGQQTLADLESKNPALWNDLVEARAKTIQRDMPLISPQDTRLAAAKWLGNQTMQSAMFPGEGGQVFPPNLMARIHQVMTPPQLQDMAQSDAWKAAVTSGDPAKAAAVEKQWLSNANPHYTPADLQGNKDFQSRLRGVVGANPAEQTANQQQAQALWQHSNSMAQSKYQNWNNYQNWYKKQFPGGAPTAPGAPASGKPDIGTTGPSSPGKGSPSREEFVPVTDRNRYQQKQRELAAAEPGINKPIAANPPQVAEAKPAMPPAGQPTYSNPYLPGAQPPIGEPLSASKPAPAPVPLPKPLVKVSRLYRLPRLLKRAEGPAYPGQDMPDELAKAREREHKQRSSANLASQGQRTTTNWIESQRQRFDEPAHQAFVSSFQQPTVPPSPIATPAAPQAAPSSQAKPSAMPSAMPLPKLMAPKPSVTPTIATAPRVLG
jgi:hypothetical protein